MRRRLGAWGWTLGLLVLVACGGESGGAECPPGYVLRDRICEPATWPDVGAPPVPDTATPPTDVSEPPSDATPDLGAPETLDASRDAPDDTGTVRRDVPTTSPGRVGDFCRRDDQCNAGLVCLGWAGGYCTRLECATSGVACPEGSECLPLVENSTACFRECASDSDCRPGDPYGCKAIPDGDGDPVRICHEILGGAGQNGAACTSHGACIGGLACVRSLPGGACLQMFCDDTACEVPGSVCVFHDGLPTCLPGCTLPADCAGVGDGSLTCVSARDTEGRTAKVCGSATAALPVGAACLADSECDSGDCETLGTGICQGGDPPQPCNSEADCIGAGFCEPRPTPVGACSAACRAGRVCPSGSFCVSASGDEGRCRPACSWNPAHTSHDCRTEVGWTCLWGVPLGAEQEEGYHCANVRPGQIGTACEDDTDCLDGATCLLAAGEELPGACTRPCSAAARCPYGTACVTWDGAPRCIRTCQNEHDCLSGYRCALVAAENRRVCQPAP